METKKGVSHVEFIISFVIFVGFVIIIFIVFNPFQKPENTSLVDNLFLNLEGNMSTSLSSVSVNVDSSKLTEIPSCVKVDSLEDLKCGNGRNLIVKNEHGEILQSNFDAVENSVNFAYQTGKNFYTLQCSDELKVVDEYLSGCKALSTSNGEYVFGIVRERNLWSKKKISAFKVGYDKDYNAMKNGIISQGNEFGFVIGEINGVPEVDATKPRPANVNVYAQTLPIDTIDEEGIIEKKTIVVFTY